MKLIGRGKKEQNDTPETVPMTPVAARPILPAIEKTVIVRPLVTEKAAHLAGMGKYVFEVVSSAGRVEVQQAVARTYGVRPVSVNIQNVVARQVRFGRRSGAQKAWKKAIVTLPEGKKIDVHEGV